MGWLQKHCNIRTQFVIDFKTKLFLTVKFLILWLVLVIQLMPKGDKDIKDQFSAENGPTKGQIGMALCPKKILRAYPKVAPIFMLYHKRHNFAKVALNLLHYSTICNTFSCRLLRSVKYYIDAYISRFSP